MICNLFCTYNYEDKKREIRKEENVTILQLITYDHAIKNSLGFEYNVLLVLN